MHADAITKLAWKILIDEHITELPVRSSQIARHHHIPIKAYEEFACNAQCSMEDVITRFGKDGFTIMYPGNHFIIFYNHGNPQRNRWTVMHELAHIFLGHFEQNVPTIPNHKKKDVFDIQADCLTAQVLCPDIIHFCNIHSAHDLRRLTDLSMQASLNRWKDLCERQMLNDFLSHPLELLVYQNFKSFIESYCHKELDEPFVDIPPLKSLSYRL